MKLKTNIMETQKMTIHRALSELKLLDSKIQKAIGSIIPVGTAQENKLVNLVYVMREFEENAKAKYQSINDLIDRKNKIKSAIVKANSTTVVEIAGEKMTISDAINFKSLIDYKKELMGVLTDKYKKAILAIEQNNKSVEANALKLAESALRKDNVKINDSDAIAITEPYIKSNTFHLVDPLNIESEIEKLENEIGSFESEVDSVLSEINAITKIEI